MTVAPMNKRYQRISKLLFVLLIILSLLQQWIFLRSGIVVSWILKYQMFSWVWGIVILCILFVIPKVHPRGKLNKREQLYFEAMVTAIILLACRYAAGGLIYKLGKSPYDLSFSSILNNFLVLLPPIIAKELIRGYVLNTFCKKKKWGIFFVVTFFMIIIDLDFKTCSSLTNLKSFTIYVAQELGPMISRNILLSYLALYGGGASAVIFMSISFVFHWAFPVFPILNWLCEGAIGIAVPIIAAVVLVNRYETKDYRERHQEMSKRAAFGMGITMALSVLMLWFIVGVFPVYPSTIATGSMEPMIYPGDIILIEKILKKEDIDKLAEGDVIQFTRDDILITHRITKIITDQDGNLNFCTKGDNNSGEDSRYVLANEIKGTLLEVIPKIGYPTLWIKQKQNMNQPDIEF